jgi:hypothetical protein
MNYFRISYLIFHIPYVMAGVARRSDMEYEIWNAINLGFFAAALTSKKKVAFIIPVVLIRDKSGNPSLLSNGVARTHFMPPDGACILTVLKPLQSLTGGSRLDALAKSAPD